MSMRLSCWHHAHDGHHVGVMNTYGTAQLTFVLGSFLGQNVTFESLTAFNGSTWTDAEALLGAAFRLHFWHSTICLLRQLHFYMMVGGSNNRYSWMPTSHLL